MRLILILAIIILSSIIGYQQGELKKGKKKVYVEDMLRDIEEGYADGVKNLSNKVQDITENIKEKVNSVKDKKGDKK